MAFYSLSCPLHYSNREHLTPSQDCGVLYGLKNTREREKGKMEMRHSIETDWWIICSEEIKLLGDHL